MAEMTRQYNLDRGNNKILNIFTEKLLSYKHLRGYLSSQTTCDKVQSPERPVLDINTSPLKCRRFDENEHYTASFSSYFGNTWRAEYTVKFSLPNIQRPKVIPQTIDITFYGVTGEVHNVGVLFDGAYNLFFVYCDAETPSFLLPRNLKRKKDCKK